jgi:hypothetical protein
MPKDTREFVRITTALPDDPKLAEIDSPNAGLAGWLYVTAICWSRAQKTDGHITPRTVERKAGVGPRWGRELIRVGLWHSPGHDCPACPQPEPGKAVIHDFLDHQQSRAETEAATAAGRLAAEARWHGKPDADRNADRIPNRNAGGTAKGNAGGNAARNADRNAEVEVEEEPKPNPPKGGFGSSGEVLSSSYVGRREISTIDDDGPTDEELTNWLPTTLPASVNLATETASFRAENRGRWNELRNVRRAWLGWLDKAAQRSKPTHTPSRPACPLHPDQPTGSKACPKCAAAAAPAPSLREIRDEQMRTP